MHIAGGWELQGVGEALVASAVRGSYNEQTSCIVAGLLDCIPILDIASGHALPFSLLR